MRRFVYVMAVLSVFAVAMKPQDAGKNPFAGTWKLNVEKSKFSPEPGPKSETVTIAPEGKVSVETVSAEGNTQNWSYVPAGNTAVPIEGMENATVTEQTSGNTVHHTWKIGTGVETGHGVISSDGKSMKYTMTGTNEQGQAVHSVYVFERQAHE